VAPGKRGLDALVYTAIVRLPFGFAPIVYRLGQEILILQSGVRFPVGAPSFGGFEQAKDQAAKSPPVSEGFGVY
jgi:hypothetical protein